MVGQGSPLGERGADRAALGSCASPAQWRGILFFLMAALLGSSSLWAQNSRRAVAVPLELRLRVKWGQDAPDFLTGAIGLTRGSIESIRDRGPAADGAASYRLRDGRIEVHELSPRKSSELEITVQSFRDASLTIELYGASESATPRETKIPLAKLIGGPAVVSRTGEGDWLSVERAPADRLRISFENQRRIFSAGETAYLEIEPHEVVPEGGGVALPLQLRADLRLVRSGAAQEEVWYERREIESDAEGRLPKISEIEIPMPRVEGAYEFIVRLENRRFLAGGFSPIEQRESLLMLGDAAAARAGGEWRGVMEIDPTVRSWWEPLRVLPQIKGIPGLSSSPSPLASAKPGMVSRDGRKWAVLAASGWQAIPLTTQSVGSPHVVQIELPRSGQARPRILLLEQQAGGEIVSVGLSAAGIVPPATEVNKPETYLHELVYWPTSSTAWLVVASSPDEESRFGSVKLLAGPAQLDAARYSRYDRGRILALQLPSSRWRELFGGDPTAVGGPADATHQAAGRLAEYLKAMGYNACRLGVAADGKSLYPSEHFSDRSNLEREVDAVEVLLRVLARERLLLIPEFAMNAPLAELEAVREAPDKILPGMDLIVGSDGAFREGELGPGGTGPFYNPLDSLVQSAIRAPLEDFLDRYAHHESFGGIAMNLTPDCFLRLPGEDWGKDSPTLDLFNADMERKEKQKPKSRANQRVAYNQDDPELAWLVWRAERLAQFYSQLQSLVAGARPEAQLYLPLGDLLEGEAAEYRIRRWISGKAPLRDLWLAAGIDPDPEACKKLPKTVFLRPSHVRSDAAAHAGLLTAAENSDENRKFQDALHISGSATRSPSIQLHLEGFQQRGPFRGKTAEDFTTQLIPDANLANPIISGLAAGDPFAISVDSLPGLALDRDVSASWIEIFRRLPPVMMLPVPPPQGQKDSKSPPNSPVVVRQTTISSRTWFYAINPCPFPVTITFGVEGPQGVKLESLNGKRLPPLEMIGRATSWSYKLAPNEIVGGAINSPKSKLVDLTSHVDREEIGKLNQELAALQSRLKQASAARDYPVLSNPDFEPTSEGYAVGAADFGWQVTQGDASDAAVITDRDPLFGKSLRLACPGQTLSIRSEPIPAPKSERLLLEIFLRTDAGDRAPNVKLMIEGEVDGRPYLRSFTTSREKPIGEKWEAFTFPLDFLPRTIQNLRVGVDVTTRGVVYLDRAALSDFWCDKRESAAILKNFAIASHALEENRVTPAQRLLSSYWPDYLREQVGRTAEHTATKPRESKPQRDPTLQDRMMEMLPKSMIQRR